MRKKLMVLFLATAISLVGCGVPNPAEDARKELDVGFISSEKDVWVAEQTAEKKRAISSENVSIKSFVTEDRKNKILQLIASLEEMAKEDIIAEYDEKELYYEEKPGNEITFSDYEQADFVIHTKTWLEEFKKRVVAIGFEGVQEIDNKMRDSFTVLSHGVRFVFYKDEVVYNVNITISNIDLYAPEQFADILKECFKDGFSVREMTTGGYIERFVLESCKVQKGNSYEKTVYVYLKDNKFLQMEVYARGTGEKSAVVFSEREKETMVNFLAWMSKDAAASEKFVSELTAEGADKGAIGSCDWYRMKEKNWGDNDREMIFRFVER